MSSSSSSSSSTPALILNPSDGVVASSSSLGATEVVAAVSKVLVHPLVLMSMLDHHTRRAEGAGRVIGTLLGRRDGDKVEVTNCFAVPHAERGDEVAIGKDFNRQMLALHLRANRREVVVGWYATALPPQDATTTTTTFRFIADTSSLIHEFYSGECDDDPVHLVVDTSLTDSHVAVRAYRSTPVQVRNEHLANMFHEIRLFVKTNESERICLDRMIQAQKQQQQQENASEAAAAEGDQEEKKATLDAPGGVDETEALRQSMERLLGMLEKASDYVDHVVSGKVVPNHRIGRSIADSLAVIPRIRPDVFDRIFHDTLQDLLMVTYLTNVTKTQLTIAEKLNAALGV